MFFAESIMFNLISTKKSENCKENVNSMSPPPPQKKNNKSQVNSAHLKIREISHGIFAWIPSIHPIQCIVM